MVKPSPLEALCGGRFNKLRALLGLRRLRGSTPWPGWPASRLTLVRWVAESCSSRYTGRVTMDTLLWAVRCRRSWGRGGRTRAYRRISSRDYGTNFSASATRLQGFNNWRGTFDGMGRARCRRGRLGGQDHNKRNPGGACGREIPRTEDRRKSEQRIWIAADAGAA